MEQNSDETTPAPAEGAENTAAETAAPTRRRASRRVTAAAGEAPAAETPAAESVAGPAAESADSPDAEAPKKRATRTRKKPAEADDAAVSAEPAEAEPTAPAEADAAPKKAAGRGRRAQASAAETSVADAEAPTAASDDSDAVAEQPARATRAGRGGGARAGAANQADAESADGTDAEESSTDTAAKSDAESTAASSDEAGDEAGSRGGGRRRGRAQKPEETAASANADGSDDAETDKSQSDKGQTAKNQGGKGQSGKGQNGKNQSGKGDKDKGDRDKTENEKGGGKNSDGSSRSSRTRQRDRKRRQNDDLEPEITEDDVLLPAAGVLDVLDNYAFVRTSGYLPGTSDVYVSLGQVKKYGLRKGDAVVGAIRQPREGEGGGRQKYNAIVKIDTVNGRPLDENQTRADFTDLTPLYPQERLALETGGENLTGRIVDLFAPVGKGQRGLIAGPAKSGKKAVLREIADAVAANTPDAHLMMVLVAERPEEVTELQRSVKGEVIASTFDRSPEDHITVAELAIERAKRLVELGHDVVLLLDSFTRLGRAYGQNSPSANRQPVDSIDVTALHPAKRLLGAARNIENGGSLTILVTAETKTGSKTDKAILRESIDTFNSELRLSGSDNGERGFPAVDVRKSSTLREETLIGAAAAETTARLRGALDELEPDEALDTVTKRLRATASNAEFLLQTRKS